MKEEGNNVVNYLGRTSGFSLMELLIVMLLMAIVSAIAIPAYQGWRGSIEYRNSARGIVSMLRDAKMQAIADNKQCRINFDVVNKRYRKEQGSQAYGYSSAGWTVPAGWQDWTVLDTDATLNINDVKTGTPPDPVIVFNVNGTAQPGQAVVNLPDGTQMQQVQIVRIQDTGATTKYSILVTPTGRIRITTGNP